MDHLTATLLQEQFNDNKIIHSSPSEDMDVNHMFLPRKSSIKIIENKDIAPYESFDAPVSYEYEWDLFISLNGHYFPTFRLFQAKQ